MGRLSLACGVLLVLCFLLSDCLSGELFEEVATVTDIRHVPARYRAETRSIYPEHFLIRVNSERGGGWIETRAPRTLHEQCLVRYRAGRWTGRVSGPYGCRPLLSPRRTRP